MGAARCSRSKWYNAGAAPIETCFMVDLGFATCDGYQRQTGAYEPCKPGDTLNGHAAMKRKALAAIRKRFLVKEIM